MFSDSSIYERKLCGAFFVCVKLFWCSEGKGFILSRVAKFCTEIHGTKIEMFIMKKLNKIKISWALDGDTHC